MEVLRVAKWGGLRVGKGGGLMVGKRGFKVEKGEVKDGKKGG